MSQCTCTTDKEATCIVHPTTRSLKARIAMLEGTIGLERIDAHKLEQQLAELREAGNKIISAIRTGLSQDELEAMEEFETLLKQGGEG